MLEATLLEYDSLDKPCHIFHVDEIGLLLDPKALKLVCRVGTKTQLQCVQETSRSFLHYAPSTRPLLLLMDGHYSHYCPCAIHGASEHQIVLFALPPNTAHLTQPLDKILSGGKYAMNTLLRTLGRWSPKLFFRVLCKGLDQKYDNEKHSSSISYLWCVSH